MALISRIEIFLEVVKHQSFAKAAAAMGMTGPAASKQVMALEERLGIKLLHRTTRMLTLTEEGARYFERARVAIEELKEAASEAQETRTSPKGSLRISAPLSFGHMHLLPVLSGFAKKYPDVQMETILDDHKVDLVADGYDVVIRIGTLKDSTLMAKHLADCTIHLVASPAYIAAHGLPQTPAELKQHRFIGYTLAGGANEWRYREKSTGKTGNIRLEGIFRANTAEMMLQAALDGIGIGLLPIFSVAPHLKAGQLLHVLPNYTTDPVLSISALTAPNRYRSTKVRLLVDWLGEACKAIPLSS